MKKRSKFTVMNDVVKDKNGLLVRDTVLIEKKWELPKSAETALITTGNGVTPDWGCNQSSSNSIVFIESSIASVIAELSQRRH